MLIVEPDWLHGGKPFLKVIQLNSILQGAHLIGVSGKHFLPPHNFDFSKSLDSFNSFYVNIYVDHHAHELASNVYVNIALYSLNAKEVKAAENLKAITKRSQSESESVVKMKEAKSAQTRK